MKIFLWQRILCEQILAFSFLVQIHNIAFHVNYSSKIQYNFMFYSKKYGGWVPIFCHQRIILITIGYQMVVVSKKLWKLKNQVSTLWVSILYLDPPLKCGPLSPSISIMMRYSGQSEEYAILDKYRFFTMARSSWKKHQNEKKTILKKTSNMTD